MAAKEFVFTWCIENFSMCAKNVLESQIFTVALLDHTKWRLHLTPREFLTKEVSCILYRIKDEREFEAITIGVSMAIVATSGAGDKIQKGPNRAIDESHSAIYFNSLVEINVFLNEKEVLLPNDVLTLRCTMWKVPHCGEPTLKVYPPRGSIFEGSVTSDERSVSNFGRSTTYKVSQPHYLYSRTRIEVFRKAVTLRIREFSKRCPDKKTTIFLESVLGDECTLVLHIYLQWTPSTSGSLHIDVSRNVPDYSRTTLVRCNFPFTDNRGREQRFLKSKFHHFQGPNDVWKLMASTELMSKLEEYVTLDTMSLDLEFFISHEGVEYPISTSEEALAIMESNKVFKDEMLRLYETSKYSDLMLRTECGKTFAVHKNILCARAESLETLLNTGDFIVDIPTMDSLTLHRFLIYMYSGDLNEMHLTDVGKLYATACRYSISCLKMKCASLLKSSLILSIDNVCMVLTLADQNNDKDLMNQVIHFIITYEEEVLCSDEWHSFLKTNKPVALATESEVLMKKLE